MIKKLKEWWEWSDVAIDNRRAFVGAIVAVAGTLFCNIDKLGWAHTYITNHVGYFKNAEHLLGEITGEAEQSKSVVSSNEKGFAMLEKVIKSNRGDLSKEPFLRFHRLLGGMTEHAELAGGEKKDFGTSLITVELDKPPAIGFISEGVFVAVENPILNFSFEERNRVTADWRKNPERVGTGKFVCTSDTLPNWYSQYRQELFLKWGLWVVLVGFVLTITSRFSREYWEPIIIPKVKLLWSIPHRLFRACFLKLARPRKSPNLPNSPAV